MLSLAVLWLTHELVRRTEPVSLYRARRCMRESEQHLRRAGAALAAAQRGVEQTAAQCMASVDRYAQEVASESGEAVGWQVRAQLRQWLERE